MLCARANNLKSMAKLPKECGYCDLPEQDWTCSVCLDDASPEYYRCDETNEVVCFDDTMRQVVTSCARRNLTDKEYKVWCRSNAQRRNRDRAYCDCRCRHEARVAIRRIPLQ